MERRIGFVTTSFPRFAGDFAGNFVFHMAEAFATLGYTIDVVVPCPPPSQPTTWHQRHRWPHWLTIHPVTYMYPKHYQQLFFTHGAPENLMRNPLQYAFTLPATVALWQKIEILCPNWCGVISHWLLPSALIAPRIPNFKIPHLAVAHSGDVHLLKRMPARAIIGAAIAKRAHAINFVSNQLKQEFSRLLPNHATTHCRLAVTPMGIAPMENVPNRNHTRKQLSFNEFTLLYVGRLAPIKGVEYLLDAAQMGDFKLVIAGEGEEKKRLEHLCQKKRIRATFVGEVDPHQRNQLLRAADVLIVPSVQLDTGRHEGVPTIISEAMEAELPIVATRTGGIEEILTHNQTGLLVCEKRADQLFKSIIELKTAPMVANKLKTNAKIAVGERYWHFLISKYHDLLFN